MTIKSLMDFLVRHNLKSENTTISGTKHCSCLRCNTYSFVIETSQVSFPKSLLLFQEGFTCISCNVIYAVMCKQCDMAYIYMEDCFMLMKSLLPTAKQHIHDGTGTSCQALLSRRSPRKTVNFLSFFVFPKNLWSRAIFPRLPLSN